MEFEAVLERLRLVWMLRIRRVIVESDFALAIATISNYSKDLPEFGLLTKDVRFVAELVFPVQFVHVPRICNGVAHRLAKFAISIGNDFVWLEDPHDFIQDLFSPDLM